MRLGFKKYVIFLIVLSVIASCIACNRSNNDQDKRLPDGVYIISISNRFDKFLEKKNVKWNSITDERVVQLVKSSIKRIYSDRKFRMKLIKSENHIKYDKYTNIFLYSISARLYKNYLSENDYSIYLIDNSVYESIKQDIKIEYTITPPLFTVIKSYGGQITWESSVHAKHYNDFSSLLRASTEEFKKLSKIEGITVRGGQIYIRIKNTSKVSYNTFIDILYITDNNGSVYEPAFSMSQKRRCHYPGEVETYTFLFMDGDDTDYITNFSEVLFNANWNEYKGDCIDENLLRKDLPFSKMQE